MNYDLVGMKVLIIENIPDNAELIHKILKRLGFQIAALKTAQDTQKQEGEAVVNLIQGAVQAAEQAIVNNIDVTA